MVLGFKEVLASGEITTVKDFTIRDGKHLLKYSGKSDRISVPEGITSIGAGAFRNNLRLTAVKLPESTESIEKLAFAGCSNLKTVSVPESLANIHSRAFADCIGLVEFRSYRCSEKTLNKSAKTRAYFGSCIFSEAFMNCRRLKYADIPYFEKIDACAFYECEDLSVINLPESLKSIGSRAFYGCRNMRKIKIPAGLSAINYDAFEECPRLEYIDADERNPVFVSVDGILCSRTSGAFDRSGRDMLIVPPGRAGELTVPDTVNSIEGYSFRNCSRLTKINIPVSVKRIGEKAFWKCSGIKEIYINGSSVKLIEKHSFSGCDGAVVYITSRDGRIRYALDLKSDKELQSPEWSSIELRYPQVMFRKISDRAAKIGIVLSCLNYGSAENDDIEAYYRKYILSCAKDSVKYAIDHENMRYLEICRSCGAIRKRHIDEHIEYSAENGKTEFTAFLLRHKQEHFSDETENIWENTDENGEYDIDLDLELGDLPDF